MQSMLTVQDTDDSIMALLHGALGRRRENMNLPFHYLKATTGKVSLRYQKRWNRAKVVPTRYWKMFGKVP